jgi:hypothetical protein
MGALLALLRFMGIVEMDMGEDGGPFPPPKP